MRSFPHWLKVSIITLLSIGALGLALVGIGVKLLDSYGRDFSKEPPNHAFGVVFQQSPPSGVMVTRASGRHKFIKMWVWMRLHVSADAIDPFLKNYVYSEPMTGSDALQAMTLSYAASGGHTPQDKQRVGWEDTLQIRRPEVYRFACGPPLNGKEGWLWNGIMIVDRPHHTVFVHAGGD